MYTLKHLFDNTKYNSKIFTDEEVKAIEEKIYTKQSRDKETPYIKCLIRNKEIQLKPEEAVRQLYLYRLIHTYGYSTDQIAVEHAVHFGRETKRADIVIFEKSHPTVEYIIVEVKKPKLFEGKEQLKSYCNATGATMGVWTNGEKISFYQRKAPNYFEDIPNIPRSNQKLKDILTERWTFEDLIYRDKLLTERKTLAELIEEMEDEVLANAGVDVFEEVFKLIYTKLYDEMESGRDEERVLEFRNYGESDEELKETIQNLFEEAKDEWTGVFDKDSKIKLTPSHLAICVSSLQDVKLFNSNLDVVDEAFEYLMSKSQKGEKGQYFTPRYIIDMCVKMLNPKKDETMIDTAAGSCGFPVHTMFHVWYSICRDKGIPISHLFTTEKKPPECIKYVEKNVFAIDFDEKAVRVARTLNLIAGDGKTNVLWLNTLDYERWDEVLKDDDWKDIYYEGWKRFKNLRRVKNENRDFNFDIVMANPPFAGDIKESKIIMKYDIAKKSEHSYQSKIGRDILFIERNLQFLKPGGRMAIVLPQGRFNNSSDKYIRDFIAERCRILAVVGLHGNVFKPHTGTKTSVLFVQKWDDELCPYREDYSIFFATMQKPSKDNSGEKIFVTNEDGTPMLDKHKHLIVDHDLYNHDGLTQDGIAEAFIEFAKREKLSFFELGSFNEEKYKTLLKELEISERDFLDIIDDNEEFRIDSEYYKKEYNAIYGKLKHCELLENIVSEMHDVTSNGSFEMVHNILNDDEEKIIPYIRSGNVGNTFIDTNNLICISKKAHDELELSQTKLNDVIMARKGKIGGASIITDNEVNYNCNENVIKLTIKNWNEYNPYYFTTFFNSKYGKKQIERLSTGNVQPWVSIFQLKKLKCYKCSNEIQNKIEKIINLAHEKLLQANNLYHNAEKILEHTLGLENFKPSNQNISIKSIKESFGSSGRLDAEYYQAKYEDYFKLINDYPNGTTKIKYQFEHVKKVCDRKQSFYNYVEIGDVNVSNGIANVNNLPVGQLPDNAKIMTCAGDLIVSKVRPNRGAVAILSKNNLLVSGAFTVLRSNGKFLIETLQVLLRTKIYRELMLRYNVGTSYPVIKDEDILNLPLPIIDLEVQEKISAKIKESFALRRESENLLEQAKAEVEAAIENKEN